MGIDEVGPVNMGRGKGGLQKTARETERQVNKLLFLEQSSRVVDSIPRVPFNFVGGGFTCA